MHRADGQLALITADETRRKDFSTSPWPGSNGRNSYITGDIRSQAVLSLIAPMSL